MKKKFTWSEIVYGEGKKDKLVCHYAYYGEEELGCITYYKKWKKWVWEQGGDIVLGINCVLEVAFKLKLLEIEKTKN